MTTDIPEPALEVSGLTRIFPNGAGIHDITFTARERSVTAVIGPNGAGKTVLFSALAGLISIDSGRIERPSRTRVAYCPDVPQFEPWLTAHEVVETSLGISGSTSRITPSEALEQCGLAKVANRRVADFSRGMLQRLGIAAALVLNPEVLILDEPNSALDPLGRADIRALILEQKRHRCIVLSSHMLSEVEQLADHVVVIDDGRVVAQGTTAEILLNGLEPVWNVRFATSGASAHPVAEPPVGVRIAFPSESLCTIRFPDFETAEAELPRLLASFGTPILEVTLQGRDLDASFVRIIQQQEAR
ncbi:ABC transporter ATP-binding protein [Microbacterium oxydans]|uniref:ABC transporter ATP-binding protein n=1 Tax=Microbacterium sp. B19(2022) TaxID=2914045 RepID=UPI001431A544|nr:ABC transporter ATP-binding protein [Microbacterium sp. B19(2022)]NJI59778.1 ABC transporter ATP-binding protein [Microbacterium sp. B19(2022)]